MRAARILTRHLTVVASALPIILTNFITPPSYAQDEQYVSIDTRPGVSQTFMLIEPAKPVASVILFAGGSGLIEISPAGIRRKNNFLVRTRRLFAQQGFVVATVDAPSDRQTGDGLVGFRSASEHARDIQAVIAWLKRRTAIPVWVVGTSRGSLSAANSATRISEGGPDGVVLTATVTEPSKSRPYTVFDAKLKSIRQPVLIVHHKSDSCRASPYSGAKTIAKKLKSSRKVEVLAFEGGDPPGSGACDALSYHGFLGIEDEVVKAIAEWIKRNS